MNVLFAYSTDDASPEFEKQITDFAKANNLSWKIVFADIDEAKKIVVDFDVCLLCPQIRFMLPILQSLADQKTTIAVISPLDYAASTGENIYKQIVELVGNN